MLRTHREEAFSVRFSRPAEPYLSVNDAPPEHNLLRWTILLRMLAPGRRACAILLLAYSAILLSLLSSAPLWLDEVLQLGSVREHRTFRQLLDWVMVNPGASPLPYIFQKWVVDHWGLSRFVVRLPAALSSIACGLMFAAVCRRLKISRPWLALALFLAVPLQFRYGVEGRVYSLGLLSSVISLWLFLRLRDNPSLRAGGLYGLSVLLALYSQPLALFPAAAQAAWTIFDPAARRLRRYVVPAVMLSAIAYAPWYITERRIQAQLKFEFGFALHQVRPLILIHDLAGDGYGCSIPLLLLAAAAVYWRSFDPSTRRLLLWSLALPIAGPIVMDAIADYFFAERQLLYAMPALALLASQGVPRPKFLLYPILAVFFIAAAVNDFRQGTVPRDDLAATADAIASRLQPGSCFVAVSRQASFYVFFRPELTPRVCPPSLGPEQILAVADIYTTAPERQALADSLAPLYDRGEAIQVGRNEIAVYRRR